VVPHKILIADDDESLRRVIEYNLKKTGYGTTAVATAERALAVLKKSEFDLLISDMKMPGMDGIELLQKSKEIRPELPVIFITAFGTIEKAVEAIKLGAYDYITKPFDTEDFLLTVNRALEHYRLQNENIRLRSELASQYTFSNIIGTSMAMQEIFATVRKIADSDATVLITGESGTGKELIARAIHHLSQRSKRSMVTVNCAAIPTELLESELFGHVQGAFTGAIKDKTGKFMLADGGTIFLDEIGDMNLELQAKLLRVLEDKMVEPVGSENPIAVDIRTLAATNQDLRKLVKNSKFREDLFYRLNVIPLNIPPLRERVEDIPLLVHHFLEKFSGNKPLALDRKAMDMLAEYAWPGNVRELANAIQRIVVLVKGTKLTASDLPDEIAAGRKVRSDDDENGLEGHGTLIESEIKMIIQALERAGWNRTKAAKRLGIPRHILIYRMKKYSIMEK